jgi:hypothetical protein
MHKIFIEKPTPVGARIPPISAIQRQFLLKQGTL